MHPDGHALSAETKSDTCHRSKKIEKSHTYFNICFMKSLICSCFPSLNEQISHAAVRLAGEVASGGAVDVPL